MKGVVFTEFLAFVSESWDEDMADDIVEASSLASGGAYTSVGTYDHREIICLLEALSVRVTLSKEALMQQFGFYLAGRFSVFFPQFFTRCGTLFAFLASIDDYIHVEVKKLYPDAELPSFDVLDSDEAQMSMRYRSSRKMEALAEGLIYGAAHHFGRTINVVAKDGGDGSVIFVINETHS
ncbi:heme NO-binding domain-containing protein [Rhizobium oryziradicis]|uniref:Heme NO-binding domain-containing protein n=1 Tax=Rhizobium oryziradicis TaxID=1867956 RepID=A0A1Q8ZRA6_9HYPH|nr:heme NO-binding domain-containing protein [Rhizobium oryziradicis]OLP44421.1 hypothetical protein BJF95_07770 [Rhizobium oryziradicis]